MLDFPNVELILIPAILTERPCFASGSKISHSMFSLPHDIQSQNMWQILFPAMCKSLKNLPLFNDF